MDKGDFGKIRNAVKEQAEHTGGSYRDVLDSFRVLKHLDADMLNDAIQGLSGIREVKTAIGKDKYDLFISVAVKKEQQLQIADGRLEAILAMRTGQAQDLELLKFVRWSMVETANEIRNDSAIQAAFSNQGEELNKLITTTKVWMESMIASRALRESLDSKDIQ